eukprot:2305761-Prymnesium_polylepis.1
MVETILSRQHHAPGAQESSSPRLGTNTFFVSLIGTFRCPNLATSTANFEKKSIALFGLFLNSAAAERVFPLLKLMFGDMQMQALADMIQAALMLKYNQRKVG